MRMLLWVVAAVMVFAAVMLVVDVGVAAMWIAVIAVGIATVVIAQMRTRHDYHS